MLDRKIHLNERLKRKTWLDVFLTIVSFPRELIFIQFGQVWKCNFTPNRPRQKYPAKHYYSTPCWIAKFTSRSVWNAISCIKLDCMCLSRYLALLESLFLFSVAKFQKCNFTPNRPRQNYPAQRYYSTPCWIAKFTSRSKCNFTPNRPRQNYPAKRYYSTPCWIAKFTSRNV